MLTNARKSISFKKGIIAKNKWDFYGIFKNLWYCLKSLNFRAKNGQNALSKMRESISLWRWNYFNNVNETFLVILNTDIFLKVWIFVPKMGKMHFGNAKIYFSLKINYCNVVYETFLVIWKHCDNAYIVWIFAPKMDKTALWKMRKSISLWK